MALGMWVGIGLTRRNAVSYHPDAVAWASRVATNGGTLTSAELAAHSTWRTEVGDTIFAKMRAVHFYWVGNALAARTPFLATWGPTLLTIDGSPTKVADGYQFGGIAGERILTGITPSSQSGFSSLDQFFMFWGQGRSTAAATDQPLCGGRSNSGTYRTGANWRTANSMEVGAGLSTEANNNYSQTNGPFAGSIGVRALSGTAVSYKDGVLKTSTTAYVTDAKSTSQEWVGGMNGIGAAYYTGIASAWMRGMGLTQAEYITVHQATQRLADTLVFARTIVARGDSLVAAGSGLTAVSGATDTARWWQYATADLGVGSTTTAQIQTAQDLELASVPNQKYWLGMYSAGRNDFRSISPATLTPSILALLNSGNPLGHYRWLEIPPKKNANLDEDVGSAFFNDRVAVNTAMEEAIDQRVVRYVDALRSQATLSDATDIADLLRGLIPSTLAPDGLHPNTAPATAISRRMMWESISTGLGTPTRAPSNIYTPLIYITATTGSSATVGQVVRVGSPGGWAGNPTYIYQWKLGGVDIGGATSQTYTTISSGALTCVVTATNAYGGPITATSNTITVT